MKKKYVFLQFAVIFIFFVLPPLFVSEGVPSAATGGISLWTVIQLILAVTLEAERRLFLEPPGRLSAARAIRSLSWGTLTLGFLMLASALMQGLGMLFPAAAGASVRVEAPGSAWGWGITVLSFVCGAFYEEVLYRQFLPYIGTLAAGGRKPLSVLCELLCIALFALSHRYMGWLAVLNASLCGIALRVCRVRAGSCYAGSTAHALYNIIVLLFSVPLQ